MSEADILAIFQDGLWITLLAIAPTMAVSVLVGLVIALLQAVTQIQEMTLTFVPKIVAVFVTMALSAGLILRLLEGLMGRMADHIVAL
jgi:flagellar biosynthesis protein FliQ